MASLSNEQIQRMLDDNRNSFLQRKQNPTARAIFNSVQAKLEISNLNDAAEQQADKVAEGVMKGDPSLSQKSLSQNVMPEISAKSDGGVMQTSDNFDSKLQGTKGQGQKLDTIQRKELESHTGTDLSGVNIHTNSNASEMSESINAKAFTHGQDIYFREGNYNPTSNEGKSLLVHEVAHTVQQSEGKVQTKVQRQTQTKTGKILYSGILNGPGNEQLIYTLNKDPQKGHVIGVGATGPYVILLQKALNYVYKDVKDFIPLKLQKDFGPKTKAAVSRFQKDNNLTMGKNGVVGPETIECLDKLVAIQEETEIFQTSMELKDVYGLLSGETKFDPMAPVPSKKKGSETVANEGGFGVEFEGAGVPTVESYFYKGGSTKVTNEVALSILENVADGEPAFKPSLGKGGASWFTTEGNPSIGKRAQSKPVQIDVEIFKRPGRLFFWEADLVKMHNEELKRFEHSAESKYREYNKIPAGRALTAKEKSGLEYYKFTRAEESMWTRVGRKVANSKVQQGEVVLQAGSKFSKNPGTITVVADPTLIEPRGGLKGLIDQLTGQGLGKEPVLIETGEKLAKKLKWAGEVKGAFRYAGRILFVIGIAQDMYKVYKATDKVKAVVESAGGWAGASAAATTFAELWTPLDAAGPVAWALHGVGTLIAGAVGYWVGSSTTRVVYEVAVEPEPAPKKVEKSEFGGFGGGGFGGGGSGGGGSGGKW